LALKEIRAVDGGRRDVDHDLTGTRLGVGDLGEGEDLGPAVGGERDGAH
jgi:hypothetical protein